MKFFMWASKDCLDDNLAGHLSVGAKKFGDEVTVWYKGVDGISNVIDDFDGAMCFGISPASFSMQEYCRILGKRFIFFDKGYLDRSYVRVSIDAWQPTKYINKVSRSSDRFDELKLMLPSVPHVPYGSSGSIMFAGCSQKYCDFHQLGDATAYAASIFNRLANTHKQYNLIYRPKPGWVRRHPGDVKPIPGTRMSDVSQSIQKDLMLCKLLVTHGSNAAFDAFLMGMPVLVLGDHITRFLSVGWDGVNRSVAPDLDLVRQLMYNAAYCQWHYTEFLTGVGWKYIREALELAR